MEPPKASGRRQQPCLETAGGQAVNATFELMGIGRLRRVPRDTAIVFLSHCESFHGQAASAFRRAYALE